MLMSYNYLKETAMEFIENYPSRLTIFLNEYEADEIDYIDREIEYFENTLNDIINFEASIDGYSITGTNNFSDACNVCDEIGFEKFKYATLKKIKYLNDKKTALSQIQRFENENIREIEKRVRFKDECMGAVYDILKDYFNPEHQSELKKIIETGSKASEKLIFIDKGNRLTDTFKKLIEQHYIVGCEKKDLSDWIVSNFCYTNRGVKEYIWSTVNDTISNNKQPCKNPLIDIKNGQIQKSIKPKSKNYNNL
jgi:hypothetical protein